MPNIFDRSAGADRRTAEPRRGPSGRRTLAAASAVAALVAVGGCGWIARPAQIVVERFGPKPETATAEMGVQAIELTQLSGEWVQAPPDPRRASDPTTPHWRHAGLDAIAPLEGAARPNLLPALDTTDAVLRGNAAIGLARWGDGRSHDVLVATVENASLKLPQREAAAEALGGLTKPSPVRALRRLLDRFGRYDPSLIVNYVPELHADLLRSLSRHVDAAVDPRFNEALRAPRPEPRQEALYAWGRSAQVELPTAVADLRADPDPRIRAAAISMLLARRHPQAFDFARNALQDFDTDVRLAAIAGLGAHGGPEAAAMLKRLMLHEGEILRAAAVPALHALGAHDDVWAAADDKSWRVRRSVAQCLTAHPDRRGAALARKFLSDDGAEVRKAAVAALEAWPLESAGPVLLSALAEPTYETRKLAAEQLARRWPPAVEFTPDVPAERRGEAVAALERRWTAQFGLIDHAALAAAASGPAPSQALAMTAERLDELQRTIEALAAAPTTPTASLDAFGADLLDALDRLVVERGLRIPDVAYHQALPAKGEAFAALDELTEADVHRRRRAAERLEQCAAEAPLRPAVVVRLAELGARESDGLVLRGLFEAVARDPSPPSSALALAGLSHPSPEVRRMACEHLGRLADPRYAPALAAAASDPHETVVLAAVKAMARPGMLADAASIERLQASGDVVLRIEAARALYANGLPAGAAALERAAYDADPAARRRAAAAMGQTGDRVFLPTLAALLGDSRLDVRKTALDGLVALVGRDVSLRPDEPLPSLDERAARWRTWYEQQAAGVGPPQFGPPAGLRD